MTDVREEYTRYYSEKIWEMIPEVYRGEDGAAERPGQLRAFIEALAQQAALLRLSRDRLWDDQFIDLSDDWAVPYIGDLVATRMLSVLDRRARRVDVAKTVYYRRRNGTPRILEELISDVTGWEGKLVEEMKRLARFRHSLDPFPGTHAGHFTDTAPGGFASLRGARVPGLADGPFDEFSHTPDVRRSNGRTGRYGIPKVAFHLFRLLSFPVEKVTPKEWLSVKGWRCFSFDPSGRDVPLFIERRRSPDWNEWHTAREWELPMPMTCSVLEHAEYVLGKNEIAFVHDRLGSGAAAELSSLLGVCFTSEASLRERIGLLKHGAEIETASVFRKILETAIVSGCGKAALLPNLDGTKPGSVKVEFAETTTSGKEKKSYLQRVVTTAAGLNNWQAIPVDKNLVIDPNKGRMILSRHHTAEVLVDYAYGFSGRIGAGSYSRTPGLTSPTTVFSNGSFSSISGKTGNPIEPTSINQIGGDRHDTDSATYSLAPGMRHVRDVIDVTIQAADGQRPYVRLEDSWRFTAASGGNALLKLDGLWIGSASRRRSAAIVLRGNYRNVLIRHCTIDPGGLDAMANALAPVHLSVEGHVDELIVESSITGPIDLHGSGMIEKLSVRDSIVQSIDSTAAAIDAPSSDVRLERVTLLGPEEHTTVMRADTLFATEALINGVVNVADTQGGCFRFSAAVSNSRLPRSYESHSINDTGHFFTSIRFGDPGYAQLTESAPAEIRRGAENGSEIGAFCSLLNPIKQDDLLTKIGEYLPFGLIPLFIYED
jgi:hypothetical protein